MVCSTAREKQVDRFGEQLGALQSRRKDTIAELVKTKNARESLERIREEAKQLHMREQLRLEQKELDEGAQISFVRKMRRIPANEPLMGG